ncbi:MAG: hypothetical protein AB1Z98_37160 [Nannocystaceae bacterium]
MFAGCRCPRCPDDRVLRSSKVEGKEVLSCRRCGGVFVGLELALRLLAVLEADVPPLQEDDPHVACPVCRAAMRCALPSGVAVQVEVCRRHGVWFQDQDLVIVTRAVAEALGKPVPQVVASLDAPATPSRAASPAVASSPKDGVKAPDQAWSPTPTRSGGSRIARTPQPMTLGERAGHTALDVVGTGVGVVADVADVALGVVSLPVELSLAIVGGLGELFD